MPGTRDSRVAVACFLFLEIFSFQSDNIKVKKGAIDEIGRLGLKNDYDLRTEAEFKVKPDRVPPACSTTC